MVEKMTCDCEEVHEEALQFVKENALSLETYEDLSYLFKAFSDVTRVRILHALEIHEMCVCDLADLLGVTKSAVSHQLKILKMLNLVKNRREAQTIYYSLADDHVKTILEIGLEHINE